MRKYSVILRDTAYHILDQMKAIKKDLQFSDETRESYTREIIQLIRKQNRPHYSPNCVQRYKQMKRRRNLGTGRRNFNK